MRFTVALICLLGISSSYAIKVDKKADESKDKREAGVSYPSSGHSTHTLQIQPSHDDGNAISIGAGYSVGGKPSFSYEGHQGSQYQVAQQPYQQTHQQTIQLAPITLQPEHGSFASSADLSQLMSQLTHGLQTGAISLQQAEPSHQYGSQEASLPQFTYGEPKLQQYSVSEQAHSSPPSYAAGSKGLGSYGATGPVLFNPSDSHGQGGLTFAVPHSSYSFGDSAGSFPGLSVGHSGGHSLGGAGYSVGGSGHGHSLGGSGLLLGGHSFGGAGHGHFGGLSLGKTIGTPYIKSLGSYTAPSKNSFKPSAFIGSSVGESGHLSAGPFSGAPSFGSPGAHGALAISTGHAPSFGNSLGSLGGSSKYAFAPKAESYSGGGSFDSSAAFAAAAAHTASPPGTTYGSPSLSFGLSSGSNHGSNHGSGHSGHAAHAASNPQYYISQSKVPSSSFGESGSAYRAPAKSHSSFSLGPKFSNHGNHGHSYSAPSSHYSPKDIQGSYSENSYNTIKYSEELKPRSH